VSSLFRLHSAGHQLADASRRSAPDCAPSRAITGIGEARVEFEGDIDDALDGDLTEKIATQILVRIVGDSFASRALAIGEFTSVGCGGVHVSNTAELAGLAVTGFRSKKGRLRISYEAELV